MNVEGRTTMAEEQSLELALRRNRGRLIRDPWLADLSQACRAPVTPAALLDLTETERLKEAFVARLINDEMPLRSRLWKEAQEKDVYAALAGLAKLNSGVEIILFSSVDDLIGGCALDAARVLENATEVWKVVKNDFGLATRDVADGLCLERNYASQHGGYVFELSVWGRFVPV